MQMFVYWEIDKQIVEHPCNEIPVNDKKERNYWFTILEMRSHFCCVLFVLNHYVKWRKQDKKELHALWLHL